MKEHCEKVVALIRNEISSVGPISFARFMELALYAPGFGYYVAGAKKLGPEGDFVTAPEISSLFSQCLANKCAEVLSAQAKASVLELGAGSGVMARDILGRLKEIGMLPENYFILELSADLKQRQQDLLKNSRPDFFEKIIWLDQLPQNFSGIIVANEVIDAMPVHRFKKINDEIWEIKVDWKNDQFVDVLVEAEENLIEAVEKLNVPNNYESEINLVLRAWIAALSESLKQGEMIFIDYGFPAHEFYHPDRYQGTLMCHFKHQAHMNPYINVGVQDITAHVNFSAVADAAQAAGCQIKAFDNQANFLINYGLIELLQSQSTPNNQLELTQQVKLLTLPSEMGELFKVIVIKRN